jgi:hypothetical protein
MFATYCEIIEQPATTNEQFQKLELSLYEISGTGNIEIRNTGGSSAAEGGMGDGGGTEKGAGIKTTDDKDKKGTTGKDEDTWDPLKPKEEKEKDRE